MNDTEMPSAHTVTFPSGTRSRRRCTSARGSSMLIIHPDTSGSSLQDLAVTRDDEHDVDAIVSTDGGVYLPERLVQVQGTSGKVDHDVGRLSPRGPHGLGDRAEAHADR